MRFPWAIASFLLCTAGAQPPVPRRFLADIAAAVAAPSCLVILAMWFALWVNGPCELF
ncbi:MAG: hypothetical protein ACHP7E_08075 [Burkholderiales bacterium]